MPKPLKSSFFLNSVGLTAFGSLAVVGAMGFGGIINDISAMNDASGKFDRALAACNQEKSQGVINSGAYLDCTYKALENNKSTENFLFNSLSGAATGGLAAGLGLIVLSGAAGIARRRSPSPS